MVFFCKVCGFVSYYRGVIFNIVCVDIFVKFFVKKIDVYDIKNKLEY